MDEKGKREISVLYVGGGVSGALRFVGLAVLARLAGPAPMGEFALYMATVTVLSSVGTLGLDHAVLLGDEDAGNSAWWASLLASIPIACIAALMLTKSPSAGDQPLVAATVAGIAVCSGASVVATTKLLLRQRRMAWIASLQVLIVGSQLAAQLLFLVLGHRPFSALVLGVGLSSLAMWALHTAVGFLRGVRIGAMAQAPTIAWQNRNLATFTVPVLLVRRYRDQALLTLVSGWCGSASAGFYQTAQRLTLGFAGMAVSPIGAISQGAMSRERDNLARIEAMLARHVAGAIRWSVAVAAPIAAFPDAAVRLALGPEWLGSAPLLPWFAWSAVAFFAFSWGDRGLIVARRQHRSLAIEAAMTAAALGLAYAAAHSRDCVQVVAVTSVVLSLGYAGLAYLGARAVGARPLRIARRLIPEGSFWFVGIVVAVPLSRMWGGSTVGAVIFATLMLAMAWLLARRPASAT